MNKVMTNLLGTFLVLTSPSTQRRERGQGSLEYVGMIAVAAIIIVAVAVVAKAQGPIIGNMIAEAITKVKGGI